MTVPNAPVPPAAAPIQFECGDVVVRLDGELPGDAATITAVVNRVLTRAREVGCIQGKELGIETVRCEALAKAVGYGSDLNASTTVRLSVACDQERGMMIVVRGPGPGLNPAQGPSPVAVEQIFSHHGRRIFLISQPMDRVEFGHGRREIRMHERQADRRPT